MYAPIFFPPVPPPSPDVLAAERAILEAEGAFHVDGRYYANTADADLQRRWAAECRVREVARRTTWRERCRERRPVLMPASDPTLSTWLTESERLRVDAARAIPAATVHRNSLRAVRDDLATGRAHAALVSAALVRPVEVPGLAALVRGFPGMPVVAFVSDADQSQALAAAVLLGRAGVLSLIDCRTPEGWRMFREILNAERLPDAFMRQALAKVLDAIGGVGNAVTEGCARFFAVAFSPCGGTTKTEAARLGVRPSTLTSRFYRAALPSPKQYLSLARLVWAARLGEMPGVSITAIACRLDASSPQSFGRTVRLLTGVPASEFRRRFTGDTMLAHFCATLVEPYRDTLRTFDPIDGSRDQRTHDDRTNDVARGDREIAGRAA